MRRTTTRRWTGEGVVGLDWSGGAGVVRGDVMLRLEREASCGVRGGREVGNLSCRCAAVQLSKVSHRPCTRQCGGGHDGRRGPGPVLPLGPTARPHSPTHSLHTVRSHTRRGRGTGCSSRADRTAAWTLPPLLHTLSHTYRPSAYSHPFRAFCGCSLLLLTSVLTSLITSPP